MDCKFLQHGLAIAYDHVAKPCCTWKYDSDWQQQNHVDKLDLINWHASPQIIQPLRLLQKDTWPKNCQLCENIEQQGRHDSMRGNGNHSYAHYQGDDISLEIRPGSVCNFACQTCWPAASSRVANFHHQAGLIDINNVDSSSLDNFDFLLPIKHRIKDVVVLGGEPFYDKSCKKFLAWAQQHLAANLMMFTNGSQLDFDFLQNYAGKLTLIFSLDAVGRPAEYIRYGTEWSQVLANFMAAKSFCNVEIRVNITSSVYNYAHLFELIDFLCEDWPHVVTFGTPTPRHFLEGTVPLEFRPQLINSIQQAVERVKTTDIEAGQKINAVNALNSHINNLKNLPWDRQAFETLKGFVAKMDQVKNIRVADYCDFLSTMLEQKIA